MCHSQFFFSINQESNHHTDYHHSYVISHLVTPTGSIQGRFDSEELAQAVKEGPGPESRLMSEPLHRGVKCVNLDRVLELLFQLRRHFPLLNTLAKSSSTTISDPLFRRSLAKARIWAEAPAATHDTDSFTGKTFDSSRSSLNPV
jgi:hypothetical protein